MDSVFIHWNRVYWTKFLFGPPRVLQIALKKLSKQHSKSLSFPPTLSLSHSHSHSHSISLHTLIPSRSVSQSHSLSLRRRLSLSISFPLLPCRFAIPTIIAFWQWFLSQQPQGIILIWSLLCGFWVLYHCMNDCLDCLCVLEKWVVVVGFAYLLFLLFFFSFFGCNVNWVECLNWRLMGFWIFIFIKWWLLLLLLLLYISVIWIKYETWYAQVMLTTK